MSRADWERFRQYLLCDEELGIQLDISKVDFSAGYIAQMETRLQQVYARMRELEGGALANPDEKRMVGHYWLSDPGLAPTLEIGREIEETAARVREFAGQVHTGEVRGGRGRPFKNVLVIGIGGSSLGPRFVSEALGGKKDLCSLYFLDNTDPDGIDRVFARLADDLDVTLTVVISKSGGTVETRNGMEEARIYYRREGLDFKEHAVSITQPGSRLDRLRTEEGWLKAFPVWEWVGGRTSVLSPVGLLPLALQGIDIDGLHAGARKCNCRTRTAPTKKNPAALLALMWYALTKGEGGRQMIILPYKDRLELLGKYLQQLIMESLGKERDMSGHTVCHGITVLGNKGSTDQHSYIQQLLDGPDNFLVTFIEVLKDREGPSVKIAEGSTSGDYLHSFLLGTRKALSAKGRSSVTLTIDEVSAETIGVLIALFERVVSFYALLVNINAYHQPAVELCKRGAGEAIALKNRAMETLRANRGKGFSVEELTAQMEEDYPEEKNRTDREMLYKILQHLAANPDYELKKQRGGAGQEETYLYY